MPEGFHLLESILTCWQCAVAAILSYVNRLGSVACSFDKPCGIDGSNKDCMCVCGCVCVCVDMCVCVCCQFAFAIDVFYVLKIVLECYLIVLNISR